MGTERPLMWRGAFLGLIVVLGILGAKRGVCQDWPSEALVKAIIHVESSGQPYAVSPKGAVGLMGLMPVVVAEYAKEELGGMAAVSSVNVADPQMNKKIGVWYLQRIRYRYLKGRYTLERCLAAYNGGIGRLKSVGWDWKKMPRESVEYVVTVKMEMKRIAGKLPLPAKEGPVATVEMGRKK